MARQKLSDGEATRAVTFKLPESELTSIRDAADRADMSVSEYVRFAVSMVTDHSDPRQAERVVRALRDAERCIEALNKALGHPKKATVVRVDEPPKDDGYEGLGPLFG